MSDDRMPLPPPLGIARGLLFSIPVLWAVLLFNDLIAVSLVAIFGESMAFPGAELRDSPNDIPMRPISYWPFILTAGFAILFTLIDLLIARRLPYGRGPLFAVFGLITVPYLLFLAATVAGNPLTVIVFNGGDAGYPVIAPGPPWYQPIRGTLLVLILLSRVVAVIMTCRPAVARKVRSLEGTATRPGLARIAMVGLIILAAAAVAIMVLNVAAALSQWSAATALGAEPHSLTRFQRELLRRVLTLTGLLILAAAGSSVLSLTFRRGGRSTLAAIVAGLLAAGWPVILYLCLLINPGGWRAPMRVTTTRLEVSWYASALTPIMIVAAVSLVAYWVALVWPGTIMRLVNGSATPHRFPPRPR